jgi:ectoine hydroxylase-related dioxygenase (phytanoyl-CoA dioxygenase family)
MQHIEDISFSLNDTTIKEFKNEGYVVFKKSFSYDLVESMKTRLEHLMITIDLAPSPFKTTLHGSAKHLFRSANEMVGFTSNVHKNKTILTIGHAFHKTLPDFTTLCGSLSIMNVCTTLCDIKSPYVIQSKAILKPPDAGIRSTSVPPHQDASFIYTEPLSGLALWWALDESNKENGQLQVVPKSHLEYDMTERFEADHTSCSTHLVNVSTETTRVWPKNGVGLDWIGLDMDPGDCVAIHPLLLHKSDGNISNNPRNAFALHIVDKYAVWPSTNWIQSDHSICLQK